MLKFLFSFVLLLLLIGNTFAQSHKNSAVFLPELPIAISFAGEEVPLNIPDVKERLERELILQCHKHSSTIMILKRAPRWKILIEKALVQQGIHQDFFYLAVAESELLQAKSPKNAVGFWQFLVETAKEYDLEVSEEVDQRKDVLLATQAACQYFKKAYEKYLNWTLVAASYNRGMGGMSKSLEKQKVNSYYDLYLNDETSRYVFRILALKLLIENPKKYGFVLKEEDIYTELPYKTITITESIEDLPAYALQKGISYKILKQYNPWLEDYSLKVAEGKTYQLLLPEYVKD